LRPSVALLESDAAFQKPYRDQRKEQDDDRTLLRDSKDEDAAQPLHRFT
jgi:hypothetical protein